MTRQSAITKAIVNDARGKNQYGHPKLTPSDVRLAKLMHARGFRFKYILQKMPSGVSPHTIKHAIYGETYKGIKE